ncbi:hypothetical protein D9M69_648280 [compost metagenome]
MISASGLVWSMNWESWLVPKNELITEESVRALIRSTGLKSSLSRTFILSLMVRAIRARPTPNCPESCSPTVRTRRFDRWSISSTTALELISPIRYFTIEIISSFESTRVSSGVSRFNLVFTR